MNGMAGDAADPGRRAGRRGNGLTASAYVPLAELDPRLAETMLEALREAGVAAYVTPSTGTTGSYLEKTLPDRPTDRLWVDSAARPRAAAVLAELSASSTPAPEGAPGQTAEVDEDESWRAIVATFQAPPGTPTWPAADDDGGGATEAASEAYGDVEAVDDGFDPADEDHYVPPAPPPIPQPHPVTRWAILALVLGFGVLVVPALLGDPVGPGLALLAVAAVLGGFGTLVARMRDAPPTDSGPDDGAVV